MPGKYRNYFLLLASYYFYYSYNPWFLLLLIGTSVLDFWSAKQIQKHPATKKTFLALSLVSNLGVLFIFKYFVFCFNTSVHLLNLPLHTLENLIIPAGLSFYTFQSISYTLDVYRGKYKPNDTLYEFLLYVSFFPHMVAGPIVRYNSLMPQLKVITYFKNIDWTSFITLVVWGYFKKLVIADNLNTIVTPIFNHITSYNGLELLLAGFLFVIQVYCDFSGYSDIATGVSKLFNINLSLNWRRPLFSTSLHDFWQRNHISITTWFRDYLYIGLGGNRVTYKRWLLNIFLVFVISGFWHGANFTFIIWGGIHAVFFIGEILFKKQFPKFSAPPLFGWLYLISVHTLSLIAFRANSVTDLLYIYKQIFTGLFCHFTIEKILYTHGNFQCFILLLVIFVLFLKEFNEEFALINAFPKTYTVLKPIAYLGIILLIFMLGNFSANTFIYFQF